MRVYVMATGAAFGVLTLVHLWRLFEEGWRLSRDPWFVLFTLVAAALCLWAWRLVGASKQS